MNSNSGGPSLQQTNDDASDCVVSSTLWEEYVQNMHPPYELTGDELELLKRELEEDFMIDPENPENQDDDDFSYQNQYDNFLKFSKHVGGLFWLDALHQFEEIDMDASDHQTPKESVDDKTVERELEFKKQAGRFTPLTYLLYKDDDNWRMVSLLLSYGANPNLPDGMGRSPLWHAIMTESCFGPRLRTVDMLLEHHANALALYKGKPIAHFAMMLAKDSNEEKDSMIWEEIKTRFKLWDWDSAHAENGDFDNDDESGMY